MYSLPLNNSNPHYKKTMKTQQYPAIHWQPETIAAIERLRETCPGTIALAAMESGLRLGEPVLILADQCIRYAKAYKAEFGQPIAEDYVLVPEFASVLSGFRAMLNFDGAALWEGNANSATRRIRDTKDNGVIESLYWTACEIAGIDGNSI